MFDDPPYAFGQPPEYVDDGDPDAPDDTPF
jgi:hypothetical protein